RRVGYTYLHSAIDGFSRLAYTEPLEDETAATTIGFLHRAFAFFAAHGITRITRLISDNGPHYRSNAFARSIRGKVSRHQRTRPHTPRHNGKVERFQRITVDEFLYAEVFESEQERRNRHGVWLHHYNYHRPHTACGDQPPASRLHASVDNVMTNYNQQLVSLPPGIVVGPVPIRPRPQVEGVRVQGRQSGRDRSIHGEGRILPVNEFVHAPTSGRSRSLVGRKGGLSHLTLRIAGMTGRFLLLALRSTSTVPDTGVDTVARVAGEGLGRFGR